MDVGGTNTYVPSLLHSGRYALVIQDHTRCVTAGIRSYALLDSDQRVEHHENTELTNSIGTL